VQESEEGEESDDEAPRPSLNPNPDPNPDPDPDPNPNPNPTPNQEEESEKDEESEEGEGESDDEESELQFREESGGEATEDAAPPPRAPIVQHIVERAGVAFREAAVYERDRRRRFAHAMLAKERAAASSVGEVTASPAAAEGEEGGELAADESGDAVAEGQHEGGGDDQQVRLCPNPNPLTPPPNPFPSPPQP